MECGSSHCLVECSTDQKLYGWGSGSSLGFPRDKTQPTEILLRDLRVRQFCCSEKSSYILEDSGVLWVTGLNDKGQLGLGHNNSVPEWEKNLNIQAEQIFVGLSYVIALDCYGKFQSWGYGKYGQLGTGQQIEWQLLPQKVVGLPFLSDKARGHYEFYLLKDLSLFLIEEGFFVTEEQGTTFELR